MKLCRKMHQLVSTVLMMLLFVLAAGYAQASTYYVPDDYTSIQAAIDASIDDDVIMIRPGTYYERLSVTKSITLQSTDGAANTIIDGGNSGTVLSITGQKPRPIIDGFTIANGYGSAGGGVYILGSYPTIRNSLIRNNTSSGSGGGVYITEPALLECAGTIFESVEISSNYASGEGGGIFLNRCDTASFTNSKIINNTSGGNGGGVEVRGFCSMIRLFSSEMSGNAAGGYGGGIFIGDRIPDCGPVGRIYDSLISGNTSSLAGGGVYVASDGFAEHHHSTIVNNSAPQSGGAHVSNQGSFEGSIIWNNSTQPFFSSIASVIFSNVEGGTPPAGDGNISADPLFVDPGAGNYRIGPDSPSRNTGGNFTTPCCDIVRTDLDGNPRPIGPAADMGAYEFIEDNVITASAGSGGTISPSGAITVPYQASQTFMIEPEAGARIYDVAVDGVSVGTPSSYFFENVISYHTIAASFGHSLDMLFSGTGSGAIYTQETYCNYPGPCTEIRAKGTEVTLSPYAGSGSCFAGWSGSGCSGTGDCFLTMDSDKTVTATFNKAININVPNGGESWIKGNTYLITWSYACNSTGSVSIELLKAGLVDTVISSSAPIGTDGTGSYSWTVPNGQSAGSDYSIRITSTSDSTRTDTSDSYFAISKR